MKKSLLFFFLTFGLLGASLAQNANVYFSNLGSNSYFTGYNTSTQVISGINFMLLADGTNSTFTVPSFKAKLYLLECDNSGTAISSTPFYIATYTVNNLKQMGSVTYENESVNLNQASGLPSGTYRLGIHVDADDNIPNPPDNTDDNAGLFTLNGDGNKSESIITFTAGNTGGDGDGDGDGGGADLQVGNIAFTYNAGIIHFTSFQIKNTGDEDAPDSSIEIFIGDDIVGTSRSFNIGALAAGATYSVLPNDIDITMAPPGTYRMQITADIQDEITESDENNNVKLVTDNVAQGVTGILAFQAGYGSALKIVSSSIEVEMVSEGVVNISLFDMQGNVVAEYVDGVLAKGTHKFDSGFSSLEGGVYICRLAGNGMNFAKKIILAD